LVSAAEEAAEEAAAGCGVYLPFLKVPFLSTGVNGT